MRLVVSLLLYVVGFVAVVAGFWLAWPPLGWLAAGVGLGVLGYLIDPTDGG